MNDLWLVPLELYDAARLLPFLGAELERDFRVRARIREHGLDIAACRNARRGQLDARAVLSQLLFLPEPGFILGVTSEDLFLSIFTFVIGEACLDGRAAVVSTSRLHDERYGLPPNPTQLYARLRKEAVHELGHCHGLVHCPSGRCVMHSSSSVEDVDLKGPELCTACRRRLAK